jgi:hypothetical protein
MNPDKVITLAKLNPGYGFSRFVKMVRGSQARNWRGFVFYFAR